jgi:hypothetical protein
MKSTQQSAASHSKVCHGCNRFPMCSSPVALARPVRPRTPAVHRSRALVFGEIPNDRESARSRSFKMSRPSWLASPRELRKSRSWTQVVPRLPRRVEWLYFHVCITMKKNSVGRFPGSSMVEHSAVNRRVASSNLARGAKLSSCLVNHLRRIRLRRDCIIKVQLSEFCPSSHWEGHFAAALFRAGNVATLCFGAAIR